MSKWARFPPLSVTTQWLADGSRILRNDAPLPPIGPILPDRVDYWAARAPDRLFLTEPAAAGRIHLSYADAAYRVRMIAKHLVGLPVSIKRPMMILGANGINHALLVLAAARAGIPAAIVSPAYAAPAARPWTKFAAVLKLIDPGIVIADNLAEARDASEGILPDATFIAPLQDLSWLDGIADGGPTPLELPLDLPCKLLFTSGSTGTPKAVINTQRMMTSNVQGLSLVWPCLSERPPVLVDWLPWAHTFGGNCCFDIALWFGGTLHIDDGKPLPALISRTVNAIKTYSPTVYFNVPAGYEALLPFLEQDRAFASAFFAKLDFLFCAAAALPQSVRTRLEEVARGACGDVPPILSGWGSTETAPFSTVVYFDTPHAGNLGVPMPGTDIKLVPDAGRTELRVRGPNVTPGYWRQPEATASAFDEQGFYRIGDAGKLVEDADPAKGIIFDGRVAENFKLTSGTWVNVSAIRLAVITATKPFTSDLVLTGEGREEIGALIFLNARACEDWLSQNGHDVGLGDAHPAIHAHFRSLIYAYNAEQTGSSTRLARFQVQTQPPSPQQGEITEKGYLNQRLILQLRQELVTRLYREGASLVTTKAHAEG